MSKNKDKHTGIEMGLHGSRTSFFGKGEVTELMLLLPKALTDVRSRGSSEQSQKTVSPRRATWSTHGLGILLLFILTVRLRARSSGRSHHKGLGKD